LAGPETLPEMTRGRAASSEGFVRVEGREGEVRLTGIQLPSLAAGPQRQAAKIETDARAHLASLFAGHQISVRALPVAADRNGRALAHLIREDGLWIEAEMIRAGMARVMVTPDTAVFAADLLAMEAEAREAGRGLWSHSAFTLRTPADQRLADDIGTYQVVEGAIVRATRRNDVIYLNFGDDYRTDFTATIPREAWPLFADAKRNPAGLDGRKVRVRGWITRYNGPALELTHPAALEMLD